MGSIAENFKIETPHNRIRLRRQGQRVELLSHDNAQQSVIDLDQPHRLALKNLEFMIGALLFMPMPKRVLILGTAAGSLIHFLRHYLDVEIVSVDIDSDLIEKMLELQLLPPPADDLSYVYDDAAHYLEHSHESFDLILVDVFSGARTPPWLLRLTTQELLYRRLSPGGGVAYNLLVASEHDFRRYYADLRQVFAQQTLCLPVQGFENAIAWAFREPLPVRDMPANREQALLLGEKLELDLMTVLAVVYNTNPVGQGVI